MTSRKPIWLMGLGLLGLLIATLPRFRQLPPNGTTRHVAREAVVRHALAEEGQSDPEKYWSEVSGPGGHPKTSWCAAFVLWVLRTAGLTDWTYDQNGAWFYQLPRTSDPKPGDIIFFTATRHLAMIVSVTEMTMGLVDGAGTAGKVSTRTVERKNLSNTEVFSIDPLLEAAA